MKLLKSLALVAMGSALLLASSAPSQESELEQIAKTGDASSKILLQTLSSSLKQHMEEGGVMNAFEFCSDKAYGLTEDVKRGFEKGVSIKRISTKFRNPVNAPKTDEAAVLEEFETLKKQNSMPEHIIKQVDEKTFKYYKPLVIEKELCLKCHGKIYKNTDLKKAVAARYPLDNAINYEMNDLRGAIVVTITK